MRDLIALRAGKGTPGPAQACGVSGSPPLRKRRRKDVTADPRGREKISSRDREILFRRAAELARKW